MPTVSSSGTSATQPWVTSVEALGHLCSKVAKVPQSLTVEPVVLETQPQHFPQLRSSLKNLTSLSMTMESTPSIDLYTRQTDLVMTLLMMELTRSTSQMSTLPLKLIVLATSTPSWKLVCMSYSSQVSTTLMSHLLFRMINRFCLVSEWQLWFHQMAHHVSESEMESTLELQVSSSKPERSNQMLFSNGAQISLTEMKTHQVSSLTYSLVSEDATTLMITRSQLNE